MIPGRVRALALSALGTSSRVTPRLTTCMGSTSSAKRSRCSTLSRRMARARDTVTRRRGNWQRKRRAEILFPRRKLCLPLSLTVVRRRDLQLLRHRFPWALITNNLQRCLPWEAWEASHHKAFLMVSPLHKGAPVPMALHSLPRQEHQAEEARHSPPHHLVFQHGRLRAREGIPTQQITTQVPSGRPQDHLARKDTLLLLRLLASAVRRRLLLGPHKLLHQASCRHPASSHLLDSHRRGG